MYCMDSQIAKYLNTFKYKFKKLQINFFFFLTAVFQQLNEFWKEIFFWGVFYCFCSFVFLLLDQEKLTLSLLLLDKQFTSQHHESIIPNTSQKAKRMRSFFPVDSVFLSPNLEQLQVWFMAHLLQFLIHSSYGFPFHFILSLLSLLIFSFLFQSLQVTFLFLIK